jgi:hypothetical protein
LICASCGHKAGKYLLAGVQSPMHFGMVANCQADIECNCPKAT